MRKKKALFFLGIWTIIVPFLGFPEMIRKSLMILTGIAITTLAYFLVKQKKATEFSFLFKRRVEIIEPTTTGE